MKVISWKGSGRGDLGLTEVLCRHLSGENEENLQISKKYSMKQWRCGELEYPGFKF
jgi:hypothetical protein